MSAPSLILLQGLRRSTIAAAHRTTTSVAALRRMSDSSTSSRHGNDPEILQRGKESILRKHSKGSTEDPHWHEELASDAEAFVKAQRNEMDGKVLEEFEKVQKKITKKVKRED